MVIPVIVDGHALTYMAHFVHKPPSLRVLPWSRRTVCTLHRAPCAAHTRPCHTHHAVYGIAYCSKNDNFCRFTGRKIAFTRAVANFPRDVRTQMWNAFWENEAAPFVGKLTPAKLLETKEDVVA